jgi:addiction module RelE/StbE family toxin
MKIKWSRKASDSFESYVEYISLDKPAMAEKWAIKVFEKIESLLQYPSIGHEVRSRPNSGLRELTIDKNFIAIYKIKKDACLIISFRRTSQESKIMEP